MAGYITFDYMCSRCGIRRTEMMKRDAIVDEMDCKTELCIGIATKTVNINITSMSYIDGNNRWANVKEQRKLKKMAREAKKSGNTDEAARLNNEIKVVREHSKRDKKVETPNKVSERE